MALGLIKGSRVSSRKILRAMRFKVGGARSAFVVVLGWRVGQFAPCENHSRALVKLSSFMP
jgi:hypothetical protein